MTKSEKLNQTPSLLEPESTGGDIASTGMDFQAYLLLCKIPYWLSYEGFTSCIWESIGDIEARFFDPENGEVREAIEAKNHSVAKTEFWSEIERFRQMDEGSPGTYRWFTLSCPGLSKELQPLVNGLRRLRDPYSFYSDSSGVIRNSYEQYKQRVIKLGQDEQMASFLFNKVSIEDKWGSLNEQSKGMFNDYFSDYQSEYNLRKSDLDNVYTSLHQLVRSQKNNPVTRKELRQAINSTLAIGDIPKKPAYIYTANNQLIETKKDITFDWHVYFGGKERKYPGPTEWDNKMKKIDLTRKWIEENRSSRNIYLSGHRRISSSFALGAIFSAVSGFIVSIVQREGQVWSTNDYPTNDTPDYNFLLKYVEGEGDELVVTIGVTRESIEDEVKVYLNEELDANLPQLHLYSKEPIVSAAQANKAANNIKSAIKSQLGINQSTKIHLFYAGPGHLALFIGHRWNALPPSQCYEWVNTGKYVPSCTI
ncbi:CD-NTase-associated endodeoxyribonuclease Cap4 [Oceanobacillus indicireducens]|uniref:SMODS-associated and fused to various effectors domain-containing protein n=1 Tax=Oceanobacillus indicireducens TaxID=1004261 RepID=A0A917XZK2_9BACI|nr:SAVED domain-containing protein [Oceanobacillus indicireducens]GGN59624.1 hypothetical protein GCM10007971_22950 [Oceanobacillus indicireducens]